MALQHANAEIKTGAYDIPQPVRSQATHGYSWVAHTQGEHQSKRGVHLGRVESWQLLSLLECSPQHFHFPHSTFIHRLEIYTFTC